MCTIYEIFLVSLGPFKTMVLMWRETCKRPIAKEPFAGNEHSLDISYKNPTLTDDVLAFLKTLFDAAMSTFSVFSTQYSLICHRF